MRIEFASRIDSYRMISGGAGGVNELTSCVIMISPGGGGVGGRK